MILASKGVQSHANSSRVHVIESEFNKQIANMNEHNKSIELKLNIYNSAKMKMSSSNQNGDHWYAPATSPHRISGDDSLKKAVK